MALSLDILLPSGVTCNYHVIIASSINYSENQTVFSLASYVDESASESYGNYIDLWTFTMDGTNNSIDDAYANCMTYDKWASAVIV